MTLSSLQKTIKNKKHLIVISTIVSISTFLIIYNIPHTQLFQQQQLSILKTIFLVANYLLNFITQSITHLLVRFYSHTPDIQKFISIYFASGEKNNMSGILKSDQTSQPGLEVDSYPIGVAVNPVTRDVYVTNEFSNTVSVINGRTASTENTI